MSSQDFEMQDREPEEPVSAGEPETESALIDPTGQRPPLSRGTIGIMVVLALSCAGTYAMYVRSGTPAAAADSDPRAQQVIKQFMSDRDRNFALMQKMLRDTDAVVKQFLSYPSVTQVPLSDLRTNPFRLAAVATPGREPTTNDQEKEKKRREEERVAVLRAVQSLQLQSVIHSEARKACMINNSLYSEGQQVANFTIEKISPNSIVVRNGSYRFELRMQR